MIELLQIMEAFEDHEVFFLTFKREDSKDLTNAYFIEDPERNPLKLMKNIVQTAKILIKKRPNVIVSTGAGVAVPACYIGKLLGSEIIFIETFCRPIEGSMAGRLVYPIADVFLVQWKEQLKKYGKKAIYGGTVF